MFKFRFRTDVPRICQPHNRQRAGAFLDQFRQYPGELYTFQNGASCIDPDGDAIFPEGHRLVFIQKAVDRHAFFLQFLNHQADRFRRDVGIREVIAKMQFIPGKNFLQGSTKAPAQRLVQRLGAAQADNDLAFGTVQFHALHQHAAEGCAELLVRRKLRPDLGNKWFQSDSFANG